ncbi:MAG: hypothetical protein J6P40_00460, partial [Oscillospiraceae bacterium]|nr:hypothetical protein [Oscillospiraceae bacterium]
ATATFVCKGNKNHTQRAEATVKTETILPSGEADGKTVYTASVIFEGKSWTDTKEIAIRAAGTNGYSSGSFSGSWTKGGTEAAEIRVSRRENSDLTEKLFQKVLIDGKELAAGQYAFGKDGTLRLQPAFLSTLEPGTHQVSIVFADGSTQTNLQVKAAAVENTPLPETTEQDQNAEKTAEKKTEKESGNNLFWWIAVPVTAGAALAAVLVIARKKKKSS